MTYTYTHIYVPGNSCQTLVNVQENSQNIQKMSHFKDTVWGGGNRWGGSILAQNGKGYAGQSIIKGHLQA